MRAKSLTALLLVVAILVVPLGTSAHEEETVKPKRLQTAQQTDEAEVTTLETETTSTRKLDTSAEAREARQKERAKRVEARLSAAKERRIKGRCTAAQARLKLVGQRGTAFHETRENLYEQLTNRLDAMVLRLQNHDIETAVLEEALAGLDIKITDFFTALEAYQAAISDAGEMDCAADVEAFYAALEDARGQRQEVASAAKAIRAYVRNDVKAALQEIRAAIAAAKTEGAN